MTNDPALQEVLDLAIRLARDAGAIQSRRYEGDHDIETKSASIDLVTEVDKACEALIVEGIRRARPDDAILAEEGSNLDRPDAEWCWIIDPLDGTVNYAHGFPRFCVSIGVERRGERSVGVVFDPLLDELYRATLGGGAWLGDRRLSVSRETQVGRSMLATGFAYDVHRNDVNLAHFANLLQRARALRRDGSAALDLCYVAAGRLDGFWELGLHPWDVAAGILIVEEAGGRCSDLARGSAPRSGSEIVATNGGIHDAICEVLSG